MGRILGLSAALLWALTAGEAYAEDRPTAAAAAPNADTLATSSATSSATDAPVEAGADGASITTTTTSTTSTTEISIDSGAPPAAPADPGTHFIIELDMGTSFTGSVGFAGSVLLGAGGKLRGFPPVFYLVAEAGYQRGGSEGSIGGEQYEDGRDYLDFTLGLRTYIPIIRDLRIFFDLLPGATLATSTLARDGLTELHTSGWYALFALGAGVQGRIFRDLSAGLRVKLLFTDDGLDDLREELGMQGTVPVVLAGTVTWHL